MTAPRIFFYVQHLLGIGHIARASRIANALGLTENEYLVSQSRHKEKLGLLKS